MEIYQNLPLTFDLHLDGLHRYDPQSNFIIKIPTKLYHNWTVVPGVITSCTMALYWYIGYAHCKICAHMYIVYSQFSETLTKVIKSQFLNETQSMGTQMKEDTLLDHLKQVSRQLVVYFWN